MYQLIPKYFSLKNHSTSYKGKTFLVKFGLNICMENPDISGRIQMERFIPVEIFRKKSNTLRGINFLLFLPKRPKFSVPFVWITSARLHVKKKWNIFPVFCKWYNSILFLFSVPKKIPTVWWKFFTKISVQMVLGLLFSLLDSFVNQINEKIISSFTTCMKLWQNLQVHQYLSGTYREVCLVKIKCNSPLKALVSIS